ncbi:MAG: hypothetical protein LBJ88_05985 [Campylobacteraceae bacterium]|nr:hypothetical protein [Campylobacteraceae bacterium]
MKKDFVNFIYMIKVEKSFLILFCISISYFVILISLDYISDYHFKLSQQEIKELHVLAENNNITAVKRLINYYHFIEKDYDKPANIYRQYKDINPKIEKALCTFLTTRRYLKQDSECDGF